MSSVRQRGTIVKWNAEKGFGFIASEAGASDVFAHAKAVIGGRLPVVGDHVFYFEGKDRRGRQCAIQVQFDEKSTRFSTRALAPACAAGFLIATALLAWLGRVPTFVPVVYWMMSAVAVGAYWHDKTSARHGDARLPENVLHLLGLFGGWSGALAAQRWFHHKIRKLPFQILFWGIVAAHTGVWIYFLSRSF